VWFSHSASSVPSAFGKGSGMLANSSVTSWPTVSLVPRGVAVRLKFSSAGAQARMTSLRVFDAFVGDVFSTISGTSPSPGSKGAYYRAGPGLPCFRTRCPVGCARRIR
jgi:hypothetical protein